MARKFIVTDTAFKMGNVSYHMDLRYKNETVLGGGRWQTNNQDKILYLWGASMDFGYAEPEEILPKIKEALLSPSMDGYTVMHSPVISDTLPALDTFQVLWVLEQ